MPDSEVRPPSLAARILKPLLPDHIGPDGLADYEDLFRRQASARGRRRAVLWYWSQIAVAFAAALREGFVGSRDGLASHLKIALRILKRHKGYACLNIAGLASGLTGGILIILFIRFETSFDRFHENSEQVYRLTRRDPLHPYQGTDWFTGTPGPLKEALTADFPDVIRAARIVRMRDVWIKNLGTLRREENFFYADPEFLDIFTFPAVAGDPRKALAEPDTLVLTEETAQRFFGREDPLGRILNIDGMAADFRVGAVVKDPPSASHLHFNFLGSLPTLLKTRPRRFAESWEMFFYTTYVQLREGGSAAALDAKLPAFVKRRAGPSAPLEYHLQPLTAIHLHGDMNGELETNGDIRYVYLLAAIGLFILLIACLNYMNLATARSSWRAKEIGVRKVAGAERSHLVKQFLGESTAVAFLAGGLSLLLAKLVLPAFSSLVGRPLTFGLAAQPGAFLPIAAAVWITGWAAGSYPAFYLSSIRPVGILKGVFHGPRKRAPGFRRTLVIAQFVISIGLIACTLTVRQQMRFIKARDLGFVKDHIVTVDILDRKIRGNPQALDTVLESSSLIQGVTFSTELPNDIGSKFNGYWEGKPDKADFSIHVLCVDDNFLAFYGLKLLQGRTFAKGSTADMENAFILNQAAVKAMGLTDPVGKRFGIDPKMDNTIIGIVDDFNFSPLSRAVEPLAIHLFLPSISEYLGGAGHASVKIDARDIPSALAFIEKTMKSFSPAYPFAYSFLDKRIDAMYRTDYKLGRTLGVFTVIALFIALLGLFGLTSFIAEQKTKEIGIRRILGSSSSGIIAVLIRDFLASIAAAGLLAAPLALWIMRLWMRKFAYRTPLAIWVFLVSAIAAMAVALTTITFQAWRAARRSPTINLRYE